MNVLLDTCTFLWVTLSPEKLSPTAGKVFIDPLNEIFLSPASAWEISIKYNLGHLSLAQPPSIFIPQQRSLHTIRESVIREAETLLLESLPLHHKDPFDRLLVCQAKANGWSILTPDTHFQPYGVPVLW